MEIQLRSVERAVSFVDYERHTHFFNGISESVFRHFPFLVCTHGILRPCGEFHMVLKSEHLIYIVAEFCNILDFFVYLLRKHKDVCIVLSKGPYPHKTVKCT